MKLINKVVIGALLFGAQLPVAGSSASAGDPANNLAVVVHPDVPVSRLTASELEAIFTASRRNWPDGSNIGAFSYPREDTVRRAFDAVVLRMSAEDVARFWLDQRVRGGSRPPRQVPDPALAVRLAAKLPGSIAYVPEHLLSPGVKVVARVRGGRVVDP